MALSMVYEKCCCGAVFECKTSTEAGAQSMLREFRGAHKVCRERREAESDMEGEVDE